MPTPFSHLLMSHRLLDDTALSDNARRFINAHRSAFLLGSVVADARPDGVERADTHFYHYTRPMPDHPWREMFRQHPSLKQPRSDAHQAFLAGYVAHLAADEYWSRYMLKPHFADGDWGRDIRERFFVLHLLLIHMDERDVARLNGSILAQLRRGTPAGWLPFLSDADIGEWRDFIAGQLAGESKTLDIFGERIQQPPETLRSAVDDSEFMQSRLWRHITPPLLAKIEADLYAFSREQMEIYLKEGA